MPERTILLTGGSGLLGRALAAHFLGRGDTVIAVLRRAKALEGTHVGGGQLIAIEADLMGPQGPVRLVEKLTNRELHPDSLVNAARSLEFIEVGEDGRVARDNFVAEFTLDVVVPYELTMALADQPDSRLAAVVNIGSIYGTVAANRALYDDFARQSPLHYSVAKAALVHLTKELSVRLAPRGIRVNAASFGGVEGRVSDEFQRRYAELCPAGRMLSEADIAGPIDYLLSEAASGMTGHNLVVDGGWTAW